MGLDRTEDEWAAYRDDSDRVSKALERVIENLASYKLAHQEYDLPTAEVQVWVDRMWNELRRELTPEDRLTAIFLLIDGLAEDRARALKNQFRTKPEVRERNTQC